jgi:hypothetical protein
MIKDDLKALMKALGLSDQGTNGKLQSHIDEHFTANPELQNNVRFLGLFNKAPVCQKP